VTFIICREICPPITLDSLKIFQAKDAKYLGLHDRRLNWRKHIFSKWKQLGIQMSKMYWLLGSKSQLSIKNKLLLYETIHKSIWAYGHNCEVRSPNIEILQKFQNKYFRIIVNAFWYIINVPLATVTFYIMILTYYTPRDETKRLSQRYIRIRQNREIS